MDETEIKNGYKIVKVGYDKKLLITISILVIIGIMSVMSASLPMCISKNMFPLYYVVQHLFWITLGGIGMWWFSKFDYKRLKKYAIPFTVGVIILLLIVKFTPLGIEINGARRWLNLGFFRFQPSEFTKIAIILLLGNLFSLKKEYFYKELPKYLLTMGVMLFVVLKQPNLSMTLILLGIIFFVYIFAGKSLKPIFLGFVVLICLVFMAKSHIINLYNYFEPYQINRILNCLNSNADVQGGGYQVFHSRIAISSGGLFGTGFGGSKEKLGWLPEAHTDFIFSVFAEEFGFIGCLFLISLFILIFNRGIKISMRCPTLYGRLLALGITISITMQAFFNMSVATAFLPATGITLPFISYGGSSLFVTMCMTGILLNISKYALIRVRDK